MQRTDVLIVGAGPAGLATAACLSRRGIPYEIVEKADQVGSAWRRHYRRLHLHTARDHSALPCTPFPRGTPTYPSRTQVLDYLDTYARIHGLTPHFGSEARSIRREGDGWRVETAACDWQSKCVVVATGYNGVPWMPSWPGREAFTGTVVHSSTYDTGQDYAGQRVLVVGCGNSGAEIALDLCEHGAKTAICIRGPVNVVPRDLFGIPAQVIAIRTAWQPLVVSDAINRRISRAIFGDLRPWGIRPKERGPLRQILEEKTIPLIDVGTIARIKSGEIEVVPGIERFTERGVVCVDGEERGFDAVVLATGYRTNLRSLLADADADTALDDRGYPSVAPPNTALPGLHFVGFANVHTGLLREIGLQARAVADVIAHGF